MPRFPHLLPADAELWERFLQEHGGEYSEIIYDVRVGQGTDPGPAYPDNIRYDAIVLSQRRIDAIGFQAKLVTIFEITCNAGLTALGQLMAYPGLYRMTYSPILPLRPMLVAYSFQSDIEPMFTENGIPFTLVTRPEFQS